MGPEAQQRTVGVAEPRSGLVVTVAILSGRRIRETSRPQRDKLPWPKLEHENWELRAMHGRNGSRHEDRTRVSCEGVRDQ